MDAWRKEFPQIGGSVIYVLHLMIVSVSERLDNRLMSSKVAFVSILNYQKVNHSFLITLPRLVSQIQ